MTRLRFAVPEDAPALRAIYGAYIDSGVTFEYVLPTREEFARRIAETLPVYPYLVLEEDGRAVGYAYAHRLAERAAYGWSAELSVALEPGAVGRALGERLYRALADLLARQGVRTLYALVSSPNPPSERFHRKMGFRLAGLQRDVGYKNGRWLGVCVFEKPLGPYDGAPAPVTPVGRLPERQVAQILRKYAP